MDFGYTDGALLLHHPALGRCRSLSYGWLISGSNPVFMLCAGRGIISGLGILCPHLHSLQKKYTHIVIEILTTRLPMYTTTTTTTTTTTSNNNSNNNTATDTYNRYYCHHYYVLPLLLLPVIGTTTTTTRYHYYCYYYYYYCCY